MTIWVPTYDNRRPMIFRFTGSVIPKLVIPVLINAVVSCAVCGLTIGKVVNLSIAPSLITVLSLVVGLLLVFRTNSAYDRYWEGRRLWGQLNASIRNLARTIWVIVKETGDGDKAEKRCAVNLLVAFAVSTKHYLREEYGYEYPDLAPLLEHIPKFGVSFPQGVSPQPVEWPPSPIERGAPSSPSLDSAGGEGRTAAAGSAPRARRRKPAAGAGERPPKNIEAFKTAAIAENLPLEITLHLASYIATKRDQDRVDVPQTTFMNAQIAILVDVLTNFERILRSPIPLAYSVHLSQVVWLFCLALPFQFVGTLGWATVPVVALASFSLVGIELIGCEIENPFGYDANDLPLDDFCLMIQRELETLLDLPAPEIATWLKTPTLNVPQSRRAAAAAAAAAADAKPKPN